MIKEKSFEDSFDLFFAKWKFLEKISVIYENLIFVFWLKIIQIKINESIFIGWKRYVKQFNSSKYNWRNIWLTFIKQSWREENCMKIKIKKQNEEKK